MKKEPTIASAEASLSNSIRRAVRTNATDIEHRIDNTTQAIMEIIHYTMPEPIRIPNEFPPMPTHTRIQYSPCKFDKDGIVNFFPKHTGVVERIEAKRNAVIFDYFEECRDQKGNMKPVITVECKDPQFKGMLIRIAHELAKAHEKTPSALSDGEGLITKMES